MIRKDKVIRKGVEKTHIRIVEGYVDENGKVKQRTIKTFGYLEDQEDPISFMNSVNQFNIDFFKKKELSKSEFTKPFYESKYNTVYNYGYKFLEAVYNALQLDDFFNKVKSNCKYSLNEIFKFLIIERILNPDSKRATFQIKDSLYSFDTTFELHDVYRALDIFNKYKIELQKYISDKVKNLIGRDNTYAYYDVTNYYNEIDFPKDENDLRQRGVSKEHRVDPIIQLGLFMDSNGIPISMSLFKGNTADCKTLQPVMKEIKKNYELNRLIVVADKGLNSSDNINYIINNNDGYVVSQILKGKKGQRYHERLFDDTLYTYNQDKTFKYQEFIEEYEIINLEKKKEKKKRKVLIYWKLEDELLALRKRDETIERAKKSLKNNAYSIKHTYEEYIKELHLIEDTGEVATQVKKEINEKKVEEDSLFDGYFCIITSEIEYDYKKIMEVYSGLWKIEETFRITKSDLETRPIYVNTESHINGHFLICYVALIIIRLLQYKMNYTMSVERIVRALKSSNCISEYYDEIKILKNSEYKEDKEDKTFMSNTMESLYDFLSIIEAMNIEVPRAKYKKDTFINYLNSIKY